MVLSLCLSIAGCASSKAPKPNVPKTPEQVLSDLKQAIAHKDTGKIYAMLDQQSRWSVMSIYRDQKTICSLVRAHYPQKRQARELDRCSDAVRCKNVDSFFSVLTRKHKLLVSLSRLPDEDISEEDKAHGERKDRGPFTKEGGYWYYAGLRQELKSIKVKIARDLVTIKENTAAFSRR